MKVRDVIKLVEQDGWTLRKIKGSHRQYQHAVKPGKVTIAGHPSADLPPGTLRSVLKQAGAEEMKYVVIYEKVATGYGAYVPDLPGCVAAGSNLPEVKRLIKGAIELHLEGMQEDGEEIPEPSSRANYAVIGGSRVSGKNVAKRKLNVRLAESRTAGTRRG